MKRIMKRVIALVLCLGVAAGLMRYGTQISDALFGSVRAEWLTEQLSETLTDKRELVVYEAAIEAQETITQEAWLIGTVQKVQIPYTFTIRYAVDLSQAKLQAGDHGLTVELPLPEARYQQLLVDEDNVRKQDWLYPLTAERYAEIKQELEQRLVDKYAEHTEYLNAAWDNAVAQVKDLFSALTSQHFLLNGVQIQIVPLEQAV